MLDDTIAERILGDPGPQARAEAAHTSAAALVRAGRDGAAEAEVLDRLIHLVEIEGLDTLAELWSASPARTLPGALWRLYAMREWVRSDPRGIADRFRLGLQRAEVAGAIAGVAEPPGPHEVSHMADEVLSGLYEGQLDSALDRAAAFFRVMAVGSALDADLGEDGAGLGEDGSVASAGTGPGALTRQARSLLTTAEDLETAADLWRRGGLE